MISLIITLIVLELIFYCIELIPMAQPFPAIIKVVAVIIAIMLILRTFNVSIK